MLVTTVRRSIHALPDSKETVVSLFLVSLCAARHLISGNQHDNINGSLFENLVACRMKELPLSISTNRLWRHSRCVRAHRWHCLRNRNRYTSASRWHLKT